MKLLDQDWRWLAFAVPVFFSAIYGVYISAHFSGPDTIQILIGGILGIVVSFPFALALGLLAVLSGQVVLVIAKRSPGRLGTRHWRSAFSATTCVTIAAASAVSLMIVEVTGLGSVISVGVIGIIAFVSAYFYFPKNDLVTSAELVTIRDWQSGDNGLLDQHKTDNLFGNRHRVSALKQFVSFSLGCHWIRRDLSPPGRRRPQGR